MAVGERTEKNGRGVLLGGVPGTMPADVIIIGGGVVGTNAAKMAMGLGARVTILDTNLERLRQLADIFLGRVQTLASNSAANSLSRISSASEAFFNGSENNASLPLTSIRLRLPQPFFTYLTFS